MKKILSLALIAAVIILFAGCSDNPLIGKWISDADGSTVICFIDEERLTVTTGDAVLDGVYTSDGKTLSITLNNPAASYSFTAEYEITAENKLILTSRDGQKEQFSQK